MMFFLSRLSVFIFVPFTFLSQQPFAYFVPFSFFLTRGFFFCPATDRFCNNELQCFGLNHTMTFNAKTM